MPDLPDSLDGMSLEALLESRVTIHQLRVFSTVADLRSFTRAAEALHLSQPAVSHQMKGLSQAIGTPLFEPTVHRTQLTAAGELLHEHAGRILGEYRAAGRAIDDLRGLRRGTLRVFGDTTVGIYVLPDVLGAFKEAYPDIRPDRREKPAPRPDRPAPRRTRTPFGSALATPHG